MPVASSAERYAAVDTLPEDCDPRAEKIRPKLLSIALAACLGEKSAVLNGWCTGEVSGTDGSPYPVCIDGGGSDAGEGSPCGDTAVRAPDALLPFTMGGGRGTAGGSVLPSYLFPYAGA